MQVVIQILSRSEVVKSYVNPAGTDFVHSVVKED